MTAPRAIIEIDRNTPLQPFMMQKARKIIPVLTFRAENATVYCDLGNDGWGRSEDGRVLVDPLSGSRYAVREDWYQQAYMPADQFDEQQRAEWIAGFATLLKQAIEHLPVAGAAPTFDNYLTSHALLTRLVHALGAKP